MGEHHVQGAERLFLVAVEGAGHEESTFFWFWTLIAHRFFGPFTETGSRMAPVPVDSVYLEGAVYAKCCGHVKPEFWIITLGCEEN